MDIIIALNNLLHENSYHRSSELMNLEKYPVVIGENLMHYEFVSEGPNGHIKKLVLYEKISFNLYNLGFGDSDKITGVIDDEIVTNNNDSLKVLATVSSTLYMFTDKFPEAVIFASGTTLSRTRLYRMGINKYLELLRIDFEVYGYINENWEIFRKNVPYVSFYTKRKN